MKRLFACLLILSLLLVISAACADPLTLVDDLADDIVEPYDESDPSMGTFSYSYRYPQVDETEDGGEDINYFYQDLIAYDLDFTIPMMQEGHEGQDCTTVVTYTVTCNNDDYFSILIRTEQHSPDRDFVVYTGNTFARAVLNPGYTSPLPQILGTLSPSETDEWLQDRQTEKANKLIREMVWEQIEENEQGVEYNDDFDEEALSHVFFPEEHFYLNEDGDPVFYLQPGIAAPESYGVLTFTVPMEDILDEL